MQDTDRKNKLLWYYRCTFKELNIEYESYLRYNFFTSRDETRYRLSSKGWDFVNSKIFEALHTYEVVITKDEMTNYILPDKVWNPYRPFKRFGYRGRYYPFASHYVRKEHHKKKVLSEHEVAKQNWRNEKQLRKDKAKAYWRRGAGEFYKRYSNQKHRAWQKQELKNHNYDLHNNEYKYFCDPWLWD